MALRPAGVGIAASSPQSPADTLSSRAFRDTIVGSALLSWIALAPPFLRSMAAAAALCYIVPLLGWFFGLPMVVTVTMLGGVVWLAGLLVLGTAWTAALGAHALYGLVDRL